MRKERSGAPREHSHLPCDRPNERPKKKTGGRCYLSWSCEDHRSVCGACFFCFEWGALAAGETRISQIGTCSPVENPSGLGLLVRMPS